MMLLSTARSAPLTTKVMSEGHDPAYDATSDPAVNPIMKNSDWTLESSMLYRWQGALVPIQVRYSLFIKMTLYRDLECLTMLCNNRRKICLQERKS